jgi:hypothetical protein
MDVSKFISLLSDKSLWLARSDTFKDKREGVFHQAMKSDLDKIYKNLKLKELDDTINTIRNTDDFQNYLSINTYINCWHENHSENMVMWEIYGQSENSVAIKTTTARLKQSFDLKKVMKNAIEVALDEVSYEDHIHADSEQNYRQPFFIKRPHFSFEQEVRLYVRARHAKTKSETPTGYKIPVNLKILITEIYVHPDAEDWFFEIIKDLIQKYDIDVEVKKGLCGNCY